MAFAKYDTMMLLALTPMEAAIIAKLTQPKFIEDAFADGSLEKIVAERIHQTLLDRMESE